MIGIIFALMAAFALFSLVALLWATMEERNRPSQKERCAKGNHNYNKRVEIHPNGCWTVTDIYDVCSCGQSEYVDTRLNYD